MKVDKMIAFMRIYCWKEESEARQKSAVMTNKGFFLVSLFRKWFMCRFLRKLLGVDGLFGGKGPDGKVLEYVDLLLPRLNQELFEGFEQG